MELEEEVQALGAGMPPDPENRVGEAVEGPLKTLRKSYVLSVLKAVRVKDTSQPEGAVSTEKQPGKTPPPEESA